MKSYDLNYEILAFLSTTVKFFLQVKCKVEKRTFLQCEKNLQNEIQ